jgi:hypothetical protein
MGKVQRRKRHESNNSDANKTAKQEVETNNGNSRVNPLCAQEALPPPAHGTP